MISKAMPLKKIKSNKRFHSSDSDESINNFETPKKSLPKRSNRRQEEEEEEEEEMVANNSNSFDVRLINGCVNGIAMDRTTPAMNGSLSSGLYPVVSLNRQDVETALKRKSLGQSVVPKATPINEREEIEERRKRQNIRAVAQRRSLLNLNNGTPGRRSGIASTAVVMSGIQLREHYTHCIQLSASNKINTKNAFGLYLIDYMSDLIKEKQSQSNGFVNFKLAGSALDAGAKIYCHRVDSVHAEAQKVASSLVMALDNKSGNNNNEDFAQNNDNNNDMNDENNDQNNDENKNKKKKTHKRNVKTLAQNIDSLNISKIEANIEIDPVFHHLSSAFDMGNTNSLLMANLKIDPNGMLLLDSNSSLNFTSHQMANPSQMQSISHFYYQLEDISKSCAQICPKISKFEFLNRDNGLDFIAREEDPSFRRNSFTFDLNADVEDLDEIECEDMGADVFEGDDMNEDTTSDDNGHEDPQTVNKSLFRAVNMVGVGDLVKMLSDKPNDYSYFNRKLMGTWAGPHHWKRCPFWQKKDRTDAETAKSRRTRKQYSERNYSNESLDEEICDKTGSHELKLKVATLQKWQNNHIELQLPADHGFDPKDLARSFIKPESIFQCAKSHEEVLDTSINSHNDSFGVANSPGMDRYDYDDDDIDVNTGAFTEGLDLGQSAPLSLNPTGDAFPFIGDNLVEQPYDLEQYNLTFAKFAKKMDVKKLKRAMWEHILSNSQSDSPTPTPQTPEKENVSQLKFTQLYQNLPKKITPVMATNLSAPIAFVTLLHLCNERNLKLIGREDLQDFTIEQDIN